MNMLSWFYWNPSPEVFRIPYLDHPLRWYGVLFVFGFIVGYLLMVTILRSLLKTKYPNEAGDKAIYLADRLTWFVMGGTIIGARLGHVFFYGWPRYREHPSEIIKIWEGGLASHGGALGILIGLIFFRLLIKKEYPNFTFLKILDLLCIPTAFAAFCIRVGNFINQEILGTESNLPWAVVFGNPADGSPIVPRHPVQLYEAAAYLIVFGIIYTLWLKKGPTLGAGVISGLFLVLVFGSRFFIEFLKMPSSMMMDESFIQTGQLLSLPFVIAGLILIWQGYKGKPFSSL